MFQILAEREEKSSIALASNLPFSEWGGVVPDPRLVAAIVDRVTFNAHIIETGTESYRLRTTNAKGGAGGMTAPEERSDRTTHPCRSFPRLGGPNFRSDRGGARFGEHGGANPA